MITVGDAPLDDERHLLYHGSGRNHAWQAESGVPDLYVEDQLDSTLVDPNACDLQCPMAREPSRPTSNVELSTHNGEIVDIDWVRPYHITCVRIPAADNPDIERELG
jgi:hypothetical protein